MRIFGIGILILGFTMMVSAQQYTSYFTGNDEDLETNPRGGICLMGGSRENAEAMKWFLERAEGGDVVVLRASGSDGYNAFMYEELGVKVNSVTSFVFHDRSASYDSVVIEKIKNAEAIWIAGGNQWNYVRFWRGSPVDSLINVGIKNKNIVIGGTSAGMAILGGYYFSAENNSITSPEAIANPLESRMTVDSTPFIKVDYMHNVITDTHYDERDRRGRHIAFLAKILMQDHHIGFGIACNERTAVCIDETGKAYVFGTYPDFETIAYFIQPNCSVKNNVPEKYESGQPLEWNHDGEALKVYAIKGTSEGENYFDLTHWKAGEGGSWESWSVHHGRVESKASEPISCLHE